MGSVPEETCPSPARVMLPLVASGARSVASAVANVAVDEAKICAVVACIAAVAAGAAPRVTSNAKCKDDAQTSE